MPASVLAYAKVVSSTGASGPFFLIEAMAFSALAFDLYPSVENMTSRADWEFLVPMVREVALPNVGLNIDTGHANLGDMNVVDCIRLGGDLIRTTHLQDNYGARDDHLPPGLGTIDWTATMAAFREVGYTGVYMVEITDCPYQREADPRGDTRTAARNLRAFLEATA